jgi:hypothetical protein
VAFMGWETQIRLVFTIGKARRLMQGEFNEKVIDETLKRTKKRDIKLRYVYVSLRSPPKHRQGRGGYIMRGYLTRVGSSQYQPSWFYCCKWPV